MKLWKFAGITLMLLGATLSVLFCKNMILEGEEHTSKSSSSLSTFPAHPASLRRQTRAAGKPSSILRDITALLQSYTEGDVQQLISSLIDRHRPDSKDLMASTAKRTKRAKKGLKPCSLKELEVSVSELGLGYEGEEILLFRYCSGKCHSSRRNYDLTLEHMKKRGRVKKGKARHKPCCRPTAYDDDISFLDTNNQYHTIKDVSAKECGCV
ncbi:neurturin [Erpetoichthys calabaricus]|uniref:neurturin n=1 Tax=Erpetoichthys calabaricus TaxID=27687 RepID=UPI002234A353|nr:neurturin [Erpetoichthys calabaricus]